jgi:hypothetical protein
MEEQTFYTEDVCALKTHPRIIGIVERTPGDVDTHLSHPDREYGKLICHKDISRVLFERFKKTGIVSLLLFNLQAERHGRHHLDCTASLAGLSAVS